MLFWLFVILILVGLLLMVSYDRLYNECVYGIGMFLMIIGWIAVLISIIIIMFSHFGTDAKVEQYNARYESLVYQYENDIYDNDNDLGKRELMEDIQYWNEDLSYRKKIQDDFWLGIYYPNIYDQFEKIELK